LIKCLDRACRQDERGPAVAADAWLDADQLGIECAAHERTRERDPFVVASLKFVGPRIDARGVHHLLSSQAPKQRSHGTMDESAPYVPRRTSLAALLLLATLELRLQRFGRGMNAYDYKVGRRLDQADGGIASVVDHAEAASERRIEVQNEAVLRRGVPHDRIDRNVPLQEVVGFEDPPTGRRRGQQAEQVRRQGARSKTLYESALPGARGSCDEQYRSRQSYLHGFDQVRRIQSTGSSQNCHTQVGVAEHKNGCQRQSMLKRIEPHALMRDKLVMVALPGSGDWVGAVRALGAKDVLLLTRGGPKDASRHPTHVEARYSQLRDVSHSNCEIGILNSTASMAVSQKHHFWKARFETILVPLAGSLLPNLPSILYYAQRRRLIVEGTSCLEVEGRSRRFLVLNVRRKSPHNRRLFAPAHLAPVEFFRRIEGVDYVLLRSVERIEHNDSFKDIDVLVSDADLPLLRGRLGQEAATLPLEAYTETGADGHDYRSAPYFIPEMARRMLAAAVARPSGIRALCAKWQYLSLAYHLIFHGKSAEIPPGASVIGPQTWDKPRHYEDLVRMAHDAAFPTPRTFADLDGALREHQAFPGRDLIGFYSPRNPFVAARYVNSGRTRAGLATFFLRDFGDGARAAPRVLAQLEKQFRVLAHGPVNGENRAAIVSMIRGGNWRDPARNMMAEPIYWFVCWDEHPVVPKGRPRRKYPNLDNQRIVDFKHRIREEAAELAGDPTRLLHASDNTDEAIEHVHAIGVAGDREVSEILARARQGSNCAA